MPLERRERLTAYFAEMRRSVEVSARIRAIGRTPGKLPSLGIIPASVQAIEVDPALPAGPDRWNVYGGSGNLHLTHPGARHRINPGRVLKARVPSVVVKKVLAKVNIEVNPLAIRCNFEFEVLMELIGTRIQEYFNYVSIPETEFLERGVFPGKDVNFCISAPKGEVKMGRGP